MPEIEDVIAQAWAAQPLGDYPGHTIQIQGGSGGTEFTIQLPYRTLLTSAELAGPDPIALATQRIGEALALIEPSEAAPPEDIPPP